MFDQYRNQAWPYRFTAEVLVGVLAGGVPSDPKVAEGWIRTKMGLTAEQQIQDMVAKTMEERGLSQADAEVAVAMNKHLNGFKRTSDGELYLEGRCAKAMLKEAFSVAVDTQKIKPRGYGLNSRKGVLSFVAEHVFVLENDLLTGRKEADHITQKFVHTFRGSGIQYEECLKDVSLTFTVVSDYDFTEEEWAMVWLTAEQEGLGASRSQGFGRFTMKRWEQDVKAAKAARKVAAKKGDLVIEA